MRTPAAATATLNSVISKYATDQYQKAALRERGIPCSCPVTPFYIISAKLQENEQRDFLTPAQRDSLLDYLIKLTNL